MNRLSTTTLATAALVLAGAFSAGAAPAEHLVFEETFDGTEHLSADENPCGVWAATEHEVRSGEYRLLLPPGGQVEGELHVNGAIDGHIELIPDDPTLPTYAGSYREKVNGVFIGVDEQGDDLARVNQYRLRVPLTGEDGSKLVLVMAGKMTMNAKGEVVVSRDAMTCR